MRMEHVALNVTDPVAVAAWYAEHLGMTIVRSSSEGARAHFLRDDAGMMIEIYRNEAAPLPDRRAMHPLELHLAFVSADPLGDREELIAAGAELIEEIHGEDGSLVVMLRDPWGAAFQLCRRTVPLGAED